MNKTEVVFVIDRSGSMQGKEEDTIGGFNSMLKEQKKLEDDCFITTILFDDEIETLHTHVAVNEIEPITTNEYYVGGMTALLDALGQGMKIAEKYAHKNDNVLIVVITDGAENSSREYNLAAIKNMVEKKQKEDNWKFMFMGAGIDAIQAGGSMGIAPQACASYSNTGRNARRSYNTMSHVMTQARTFGTSSEYFDACVASEMTHLSDEDNTQDHVSAGNKKPTKPKKFWFRRNK